MQNNVWSTSRMSTITCSLQYIPRGNHEVHDNLMPSMSISGRSVWNLKFADGIYLLAGINKEFQDITNQLSKCTSRYGIEISSEKKQGNGRDFARQRYNTPYICNVIYIYNHGCSRCCSSIESLKYILVRRGFLQQCCHCFIKLHAI